MGSTIAIVTFEDMEKAGEVLKSIHIVILMLYTHSLFQLSSEQEQ